MRRNTTLSRGSYIPAALLNAMQDEAGGLIRASVSNGAPALVGADGRHWCTPDAGVADGYAVVVDATAGVDWRSRLLWGTWARLETAAQRLQGADAWQANDVARPIARKSFHGRTGTGGKGAADATIETGVPPVVASGSFAVVVDELDTTGHRVYLYARPSDGALCLYNASGAVLHGELLVHGAGVSPTPGSPPPSPIPTLTDVLWLDPSLAADRPADPGGPAIHYATDTEALSIWDGGAWRAITSSAPADGATVYDFSDSTGWTIDVGTVVGATASISGGAGHLSVPAATGATWHGITGNFSAPHLEVAAPHGDFSVRVRLHLTGANSLTRIGLYVRRASVVSRLAQVLVRDNGTVGAQRDAGITTPDDVAGLITMSGGPWLRLDVRGGHCEYWVAQGDGTNTEPLSWTHLAVSGPFATGALPYLVCGVACAQYDTAASGPTVTVNRLIIRPL